MFRRASQPGPLIKVPSTDSLQESSRVVWRVRDPNILKGGWSSIVCVSVDKVLALSLETTLKPRWQRVQFPPFTVRQIFCVEVLRHIGRLPFS